MIWYVSIGLAVLLALSVPVGAALFILGFGLDQFFSPMPLMRGLGQMVYSSSDSFLLIAIPLFVLLGEILVRAGIAERTYATLDKWFSWLPGGLVHANIATATMFSATSGSSVATAATVATVAMPQARKQGYDQRLFAGAIAAGGALGILLPPSINLIVYGFLTQTSVPQLFMAGIVPGLLMALGFMIITAILCTIKPAWGGPSRSFTWAERMDGLQHLIPVLMVFVVIIGSIYTGWATPTEAAAIGVVMALCIAAFYGAVTFENMRAALLGTIRTTSMVMFVIVGAYFLNFALGATGLNRALSGFLEGFGLGPYGMLMIIVVMYIVLGFFIETLALMIATIPIVVPIIIGLGFDKVWFGILLIVLIEMALITPPVGLNLYVVQGARKEGRLSDVMIGAIPFVFVMLVMVGLLIAFPTIALLFAPS